MGARLERSLTEQYSRNVIRAFEASNRVRKYRVGQRIRSLKLPEFDDPGPTIENIGE